MCDVFIVHAHMYLQCFIFPCILCCRFRDPEVHFIQFSVCATLGDYEKRKKQILSSPVIIAMLNTIGEVSRAETSHV